MCAEKRGGGGGEREREGEIKREAGLDCVR